MRWSVFFVVFRGAGGGRVVAYYAVFIIGGGVGVESALEVGIQGESGVWVAVCVVVMGLWGGSSVAKGGGHGLVVASFLPFASSLVVLDLNDERVV